VSSDAAPPAPRPSQRAAASVELPPFSASVKRIGPRLRERMEFTYRAGCPVGLRRLRHLRVGFVGFDGAARTGQIVVHAAESRAVVTVFRRLYAARWPIRRMRLVDHYRGDDDASMAANNTSGFNCRRVAGTTRWSEHSYGRAIDVNPVQNPYVVGSSVSPEAGRPYADLDRSADGSRRRGVIRARDVVVRSFRRIGWEWGGRWIHSKDYQHFSESGR
jgi:poly-gamma-glutamate synthesis protein (capsule biosynthesis protein)